MRLTEEVKKLRDSQKGYLLSLRFGIKYKCISAEEVFDVNKKFLELSQNKVKFKEPLLDVDMSNSEKYQWIREECKKIYLANRDRRPDYKACINRIERLFKQYPWLTKELVIQAFDIYVSTTEKRYLRTPQRFILDIGGQSLLMSFVYDILENQKTFKEDVL